MYALIKQLDHDQLFEFIKEIDLQVADWEFTDKLIAYFEQEKIKKLSEEINL
jgi:hypothetical protein